jgi:hypothetical protein
VVRRIAVQWWEAILFWTMVAAVVAVYVLLFWMPVTG